jgi:hypothetical protein
MSVDLSQLRQFLDSRFMWSCVYNSEGDQPTCASPAVWHGFITDDGEIICMMACCDEHKTAMALSATWVHAMDSSCCLPGSVFVWPENECLLPDGLGANTALEACVAPPATSGLIELR